MTMRIFGCGLFWSRKKLQAPSASPPRRQPREIKPEEIKVAIFCTRIEDLIAVLYSLDEELVCYFPPNPASCKYVFAYGRIANYNVIIARGIHTGPIQAAQVAATVSFLFPHIRHAISVGTAGGIPSAADVRLGDIAVSVPGKDHPGVIQYDAGRFEDDGFELDEEAYFDPPPPELLRAVGAVWQAENSEKGTLKGILSEIISKSSFYRPTAEDILFDADFHHVNPGAGCGACLAKRRAAVVHRWPPRRGQMPVVHRGLILSGGVVVKHPNYRNTLRRGYKDALCFETEAAGIMDEIPCIVVRGISNYADTHKQDDWREFAAAASAAYCKALLYRLEL
ncbi:purine and uridine phosphorylase [Aspergillus heterothallicus]